MTTPGISDLFTSKVPASGDAGRVQRVKPQRAAPARTGWPCPPLVEGADRRRVEVVSRRSRTGATATSGGRERRECAALEARLRSTCRRRATPVAAVVVDDREADGVGVQSSAGRDEIRFPSDFHIFSPRRPIRRGASADEGLAVTTRTGRSRTRGGEHEVPAAAVDVEGDPSSRSASAEHSMCHRRPGPSATSQAGSLGSEGCQSRSRAGRACSGRRIAAVDRSELEHLGAVEVADLPNWGRCHFEVHVPGW